MRHMQNIELESWEELVVQELEVVPDDELMSGDNESYDELIFGRDVNDQHRWELDPASAEDYPEHRKVWLTGPSQRWRHFGH